MGWGFTVWLNSESQTKKSKQMRIYIILLFLGIFSLQGIAQKRILVFSKTLGWRHNSIQRGIKFFQDWGDKVGVTVDTTEDSNKFTVENLKRYNAIVWLNTTGDVLSPGQQVNFERYIQAGGGYVGIHAASDTEYGWPWYNKLMGGYFASHPGNPNVQKGLMTVLDRTHPSTKHLEPSFEHTDEFYDFKSLRTDLIKPLIKVDEKSYKDGKMGDNHPLAWYHEFDGGKAFYTNYGHTWEAFEDPKIQQHFIGGLQWAMSETLDFSKAKSEQSPDPNRFSKTVLVNNLDEPTELAVLPDGKVLFTERKGKLKLWNPKTQSVKVVAQLDLFSQHEYGLMGLGVDPQYAQNKRIFLYYTPKDASKENRLSQFTYDDQRDTLVLSSEKIVLRVPVKKDGCCHTGGSIDFDGQGNLFLSTGDDTNPFESEGYGPTDDRPGRSGFDARFTSANTNDLRGKVLRIKVQADGSYTIPAGNLFPVGNPKARPEIFVMGCRNPYRISVDKRTGYVYWGDVGPDAGEDNAERGPRGHCEFNQAQKAGFFGWPLFVANNKPYRRWDFDTKKAGEAFDPAKPLNESRNNTGLLELPPAQSPLVWYPYVASTEFPLVGKGGRNPMAGPVYYADDFKNAPNRFPQYYNGKFFAFEWMRDWIMVFTLDENGKYADMERFAPNIPLSNPMDMAFHSDGTLYMLEYGKKWFSANEDATLFKIEYNPGNLPPDAKLEASTTAGQKPLNVQFNALASKDPEGQALKYAWDFGNGKGSTKPNPVAKYKSPGYYEAELTVTDAQGKSSRSTVGIRVGNEAPKLDLQVKGNQSFFFPGKPLEYAIKVSDKEDGEVGKGINSDDVAVSLSYIEGFDRTVAAQGHQTNSGFVAGKRLIDLSDCKSCHQMKDKSVGPSWMDISNKYKESWEPVAGILANKIIKGGKGVWGEQAMNAHPQLSKSEAESMAEYILSLAKDTKPENRPLAATLNLSEHEKKQPGMYLLSASYTDKGIPMVGALIASQTIALRYPLIRAAEADAMREVMGNRNNLTAPLQIANDNAYLRYNGIDLQGISQVTVFTKGWGVGGKIEFRIGTPEGTLLGETNFPSGNDPKEALLKLNTAAPPGKQDIFIVFRNPNAKGNFLGGVERFEFQ